MAQELALWTPSTALSPRQKQDRALAMVRYSTSRPQALEQAKKLIGSYPHARPPDVEGYANALADIFELYPLGVVKECCDVRSGIARTREFPPTIAAVVKWCDLTLGAYRNLASRNLPEPEKQFDEVHCKTMRERLSALMHGIFDKPQQQAAE